jgi:GWxTD domain-containing protein
MERLGWTLVHFLWQGAMIAALVFAAMAVLRRAQSRYAVLCGALMLMAAAPVITFVSLGTGESRKLMMSSLDRLLDQPALATAYSNVAEPGGSWLMWVVVVWAAGVAVFSARLAGGWLLLRRLSHDNMPLDTDWVRRIAGSVRVFVSSRVDVPVVVGYLRPFILLPAAALANLPAEQLETILAHEMAHILRHDALVNLAQSVVETLLFYHPAVWWVSSRLRDERENCCDDVAVGVCGRPRLYAEALLALEQGRSLAPALSAHGGNLKRRIARLLMSEPAAPRSPLPLMLALFCVVSLAGFARQATIVVTQDDGRSSTQPALAPKFETWLKDVDLIISPEEREAFQRLNHDEERERFVEQFWERRNPTPGSAENQFKKEHYRRLRYANERFTAERSVRFRQENAGFQFAVPGSRTPRGKLYVIAGPPDELESHPDEQREEWRYRYMEKLGEVTFTFDLKQDLVTKVDATLIDKPTMERLINRLNEGLRR